MENFSWDNLEEQEIQELKTYSYNTDLFIDNAIERVKFINEEIARLKELSKQKVEQIKNTTDLKVKKLEKKKEWDLFNLGAIIEADETIKATKTQKKKDFLSGSVVRKFATNKMIKPELTEKEIKTKYPDFTKEKTEITLDWVEMKKTLKVVDNKVYNEDGELIKDVEIEFVPAQTIVK